MTFYTWRADKPGETLVREYLYKDEEQAHADTKEMLRVEFPFNKVERKGDQYLIAGKVVAEVREEEEMIREEELEHAMADEERHMERTDAIIQDFYANHRIVDRQEWTTEYPTKPGTYWVRKHSEEVNMPLTGRKIMVHEGPELVEINSSGSIFWMLRTEEWTPEPDASSAEWYGPVDPPE